MMKPNGNLFHIDFGHFLGNFKTFGGVSRETAAVSGLPAMCSCSRAGLVVLRVQGAGDDGIDHNNN
jgi:hypothetical protein